LKTYTFIFVFYFNANLFCQENYINYYNYINKAEFYLYNNSLDSTFYYYDLAFANYDYVFVNDVMNATQLALYYKYPFDKYIDKGFENGLKIEHLKKLELTKNIYFSLCNDSKKIVSYHKKRKKYLSKINFTYLKIIYDIALIDQYKKNLSLIDYNRYKLETISKLKTLIKIYGFPSSKTIGISDNTIFKEIGNSNFDLDILKKAYNYNINYYNTDENELSSKYIMVLLVHNSCAYLDLKTQLDSAEIKGEIHPREVALLYDNMYRYLNGEEYKCEVPNPDSNGVYLLNHFTEYRTMKIDNEKINKKREVSFIVPLKIDEFKKDLEQKIGAKLHWGFWGIL
jgi:hypothetical protein